MQYLVDGVAVNDVLGSSGGLLATSVANEQLQQFYAGFQSGAIGGGGSGLVVSANSIQSVSVTTSGFDAEFGNAQSGVINIVTKSGSENYTGSAQYRTDRLGGSTFNESYLSLSGGGPEPLTSQVLPLAGIQIPGKMTFFISTDFNQRDGPYTFEKNEFYNPSRRTVRLGGFLGDLFGFNYRDYLHNSFTFNSKVKYDISNSDQISYGYRASLGSDHDYNNFWRFRADSSQVGLNTSDQNIFQWTHFWGESSFHRLYLGRLSNRRHIDVAGLTPPFYSPAISQQDPNGDGFGDLGSDQTWLEARSTVWTVKLDYSGRVHPLHFLKAGFEFNYEEIRSTEIQYPLAPSRDTTTNRGFYPGYGLYRWVLDNYPNRGSLYAQDNIEFYGINVHIGLRYDYFYLGKQVLYQDFIDQWEAATGLKATWPSKTTNNSSLLYYLTHGYVSPRVAIGYPVTDRIVFYFNYGHFLQFPDRDQYFRDPFTLDPNSWVGNPDLKPQRTVQYEAGFDDQFTEDMALSVRGFYKDIFDYATLANSGSRGVPVYLYVNLDYASARGFDVSLAKAFTTNFSGTLSYSYQIAKGRSSSPFAAVFEPQFQLPRETRLNWDQRSTINFLFAYRVGPREDFKLFGLPFINNWGISLSWNYGSGFPFTPFNRGRTLADVYLVNTATGPYSSNVNLSIYKGFILFNQLNMQVTLETTNLFNRRNVAVLDPNYGFNTFEGHPYQFGDYDPLTLNMYPYNSMASRVPPNVFGSPRQVLLGVRLNWD